jgi:methylmalonyl-CoA/ethylmalonyl-CoA epimerase
MKAVLDHIGIAVEDLSAALAFYRDALGLEVEAPEEVTSQQVRAHFVPVGESKLELLEATAPQSAIARYVDKRGPGLHHITLRVDDIDAAVAQLRTRGVRMIDAQPRPGAEGSTIAFVHPSAAHGVLIELKQSAIRNPPFEIQRFTLGELELISLSDGFFRMDGGLMFGIVPKVQWSVAAPTDDRNRVTLGMRPADRPRRSDDDHRRGTRWEGRRGIRRCLRGRSSLPSRFARWRMRAWPLRTSTSSSRATSTSTTPGASPSATPVAGSVHVFRARSTSSAAANGRTRHTSTRRTQRDIRRITTDRSPRPACCSWWTMT